MIIAGYYGIGKTTIAGKHKCIDLDRRDFIRNAEDVLPKWCDLYANTAYNLSKQGYVVFVSIESEVLDALMNYTDDPETKIYTIAPSLNLKDKWIEKMKNIFESNQNFKNKKNLVKVSEHYDEDISNLVNKPFELLLIKDMDYKLTDLIAYLLQDSSIIDNVDEKQKEEPVIDGNTSDGYHTFNELYHHRAILFSVICNKYPDLAWKSKRHDDGTMYDNMFIVGIDTPAGPATYHYDIDPYWDLFNVKEVAYAPKWDGHTPDMAITRISTLSSKLFT